MNKQNSPDNRAAQASGSDLDAVLVWTCGLDVAWISIIPEPTSIGRTQIGYSAEQLQKYQSGDPELLRKLYELSAGSLGLGQASLLSCCNRNSPQPRASRELSPLEQPNC
jgi:hypothetical protein